MRAAACDCEKSLVCVKTESEKRFCYYIEGEWPVYDATSWALVTGGTVE